MRLLFTALAFLLSYNISYTQTDDLMGELYQFLKSEEFVGSAQVGAMQGECRMALRKNNELGYYLYVRYGLNNYISGRQDKSDATYKIQGVNNVLHRTGKYAGTKGNGSCEAFLKGSVTGYKGTANGQVHNNSESGPIYFDLDSARFNLQLTFLGSGTYSGTFKLTMSQYIKFKELAYGSNYDSDMRADDDAYLSLVQDRMDRRPSCLFGDCDEDAYGVYGPKKGESPKFKGHYASTWGTPHYNDGGSPGEFIYPWDEETKTRKSFIGYWEKGERQPIGLYKTERKVVKNGNEVIVESFFAGTFLEDWTYQYNLHTKGEVHRHNHSKFWTLHDGYCVIQFENGERYFGNIEDGGYSGRGVWLYPNGSRIKCSGIKHNNCKDCLHADINNLVKRVELKNGTWDVDVSQDKNHIDNQEFWTNISGQDLLSELNAIKNHKIRLTNDIAYFDSLIIEKLNSLGKLEEYLYQDSIYTQLEGEIKYIVSNKEKKKKEKKRSKASEKRYKILVETDLVQKFSKSFNLSKELKQIEGELEVFEAEMQIRLDKWREEKMNENEASQEIANNIYDWLKEDFHFINNCSSEDVICLARNDGRPEYGVNVLRDELEMAFVWAGFNVISPWEDVYKNKADGYHSPPDDCEACLNYNTVQTGESDYDWVEAIRYCPEVHCFIRSMNFDIIRNGHPDDNKIALIKFKIDWNNDGNYRWKDTFYDGRKYKGDGPAFMDALGSLMLETK